MSGRIAWITGGGSGIGRALALELANHGWRVAVTGRTRETLDEVAAAAPEGTVRAVPADVTDLAATREAVRKIESELGPIDLAVLNAGVFKPFEAENFDAEAVNATMAVNYTGAVHGIDAVLPGMRERRSGHIALVSSVAGYRGLPLGAPYSASKAALIALGESLKFDFDRLGIRTSVINPGFVKTPLTAKNKFPMPFLMEVDDAARAMRKGLEKGRFEIAFPRPLVYGLKFMRLLPYALYFPLMRKATGR
ncbi:putative short-chain dehydrogenase/reductase [Salinisphaera sp. PC39]|uniref:SDR family NAD(P)-dependent oxidoreductase n=1 Tax=Salinisphaera sp. PC39 TaxID=1304156 RepID=UPI003341AEDB